MTFLVSSSPSSNSGLGKISVVGRNIKRAMTSAHKLASHKVRPRVLMEHGEHGEDGMGHDNCTSYVHRRCNNSDYPYVMETFYNDALCTQTMEETMHMPASVLAKEENATAYFDTCMPEDDHHSVIFECVDQEVIAHHFVNSTNCSAEHHASSTSGCQEACRGEEQGESMLCEREMLRMANATGDTSEHMLRGSYRIFCHASDDSASPEPMFQYYASDMCDGEGDGATGSPMHLKNPENGPHHQVCWTAEELGMVDPELVISGLMSYREDSCVPGKGEFFELVGYVSEDCTGEPYLGIPHSSGMGCRMCSHEDSDDHEHDDDTLSPMVPACMGGCPGDLEALGGFQPQNALQWCEIARSYRNHTCMDACSSDQQQAALVNVVLISCLLEPLQYVQTMLGSTTPTLHPTTSPTSEVSSAPTPEPGPTHQVMFHATIETDSSILDNETLKMAFETEYKEALASKLDFSAEFVEVLSMTPGSVIVESKILFPSEGDASTFKMAAETAPATLFADEFTQKYGTVMIANVSIAQAAPNPEPGTQASMPPPVYSSPSSAATMQAIFGLMMVMLAPIAF
eukprot:CAMPEP_0114236020 /NCGR_PEP_ID=MMETSP0058-20121206/6585_1 /TAXON_ID=36894 /ORGANISM="Pyramimonas parkeae, CCMP726" /LENGTH=571 /DNA_ID=CAMNT_0001347869 /DNA_START=153 /DNA_END=1871 /DNA_ORIENTATION=-